MLTARNLQGTRDYDATLEFLSTTECASYQIFQDQTISIVCIRKQYAVVKTTSKKCAICTRNATEFISQRKKHLSTCVPERNFLRRTHQSKFSLKMLVKIIDSSGKDIVTIKNAPHTSKDVYCQATSFGSLPADYGSSIALIRSMCAMIGPANTGGGLWKTAPSAVRRHAIGSPHLAVHGVFFALYQRVGLGKTQLSMVRKEVINPMALINSGLS